MRPWGWLALYLLAGPANAQGIDWSLLQNDPAGQQREGFNNAAATAYHALRSHVGALAVAGRCEEARNIAAHAGYIELAQQAYAFCLQQRRQH